MQNKPDAERLDPQRMCEELHCILNAAATPTLRSVLRVQTPGIPTHVRAWSAKTWVPFFMLCLDGSFDAQVFDGRTMHAQSLGAGDALLFDPQVWVDVHHHRCSRYLRITFDEDHILFGLKDCRNQKQRRLIGELATYVHQHQLSKHGLSLLQQLQALPQDNDMATRVTDYTRCLLWECHDAIRYHSSASEGSEATWLAIRDWCARHCCEGISRSDVASAFNISPSHISRLCKQYTDRSLVDFIHEFQLRHSLAYLRETDLDLSSIAQHCGFASANYFIRVFGKHMDMTPERWRKTQRSIS